jgi:hypothetical protein
MIYEGESEGVCASCGKPLGIRANWRMTQSGRAYHYGCEPTEVADKQGESLTEHAERAARSVTHGRGQQVLDQEVQDDDR